MKDLIKKILSSFFVMAFALTQAGSVYAEVEVAIGGNGQQVPTVSIDAATDVVTSQEVIETSLSQVQAADELPLTEYAHLDGHQTDPEIVGDLNDDGKVDAHDVALLLVATTNEDASADINRDGNIDAHDITKMKKAFDMEVTNEVTRNRPQSPDGFVGDVYTKHLVYSDTYNAGDFILQRFMNDQGRVVWERLYDPRERSSFPGYVAQSEHLKFNAEGKLAEIETLSKSSLGLLGVILNETIGNGESTYQLTLFNNHYDENFQTVSNRVVDTRTPITNVTVVRESNGLITSIEGDLDDGRHIHVVMAQEGIEAIEITERLLYQNLAGNANLRVVKETTEGPRGELISERYLAQLMAGPTVHREYEVREQDVFETEIESGPRGDVSVAKFTTVQGTRLTFEWFETSDFEDRDASIIEEAGFFFKDAVILSRDGIFIRLNRGSERN